MTPRPPSLIRLLVLAILVVTTSTQPVFLLGAAFFQIGPEFGIGPVGLGALTSAFFLTASVTSAPLGRWVQRVGWQRAMRVNLAASGVAMAGTAAAARSVWTLAGFLVLSAAIYGIANPAANLALSEHTRPDRRATIFGAKHAGIPASALMAGLAVPVVVVEFGWRWSLVATAAVAMALAVSVPGGEVRPTIAAADEPRETSGSMSMRWLAGLSVGSALATWAAIALGTYLVSAALDVGFSEEAAGWLQFAGAAVSISTRIGVGHLTDRFGWSGFWGIGVLTALGAVAFAVLPLTSSVLFGLVVIVAYATGWGWPGLMTFTVVDANRGSVASSSAITQTGVFIGAGSGPLVLGAIIERGSFDAAWLAVALALAVAAITVAWVKLRMGRVAAPA